MPRPGQAIWRHVRPAASTTGRARHAPSPEATEPCVERPTDRGSPCRPPCPPPSGTPSNLCGGTPPSRRGSRAGACRPVVHAWAVAWVGRVAACRACCLLHELGLAAASRPHNPPPASIPSLHANSGSLANAASDERGAPAAACRGRSVRSGHAPCAPCGASWGATCRSSSRPRRCRSNRIPGCDMPTVCGGELGVAGDDAAGLGIIAARGFS